MTFTEKLLANIEATWKMRAVDHSNIMTLTEKRMARCLIYLRGRRFNQLMTRK